MKSHILSAAKDTGITLLLLSSATVLGLLFWNLHFHETNIVVTYGLSVLLVARFTKGYFYGLFATVLTIIMFNWFFTAPYFTLNVSDPTYGITFLIMMITSVITSALTSKVKHAAALDKEKQMEMSALYQLTNHLTDAEDLSDICSIAVNAVSRLLGTEAACVCFDKDGISEKTFIQQREDGTQIRRRLENPEKLLHRLEGMLTPVDMGLEFYDYPIYGRSALLAVLRIPAETASELTESQNSMLHSVMESTSLAMERMRSLQIQTAIREQASQERYRSNLLRAISHDIRTPLSGILGTSEMLMDMLPAEDVRRELAQDISQDAAWLHALVENILNLTKLQDGKLVLHKEAEAVEEVVGAAVLAVEKRFPGREITMEIPDKVLLVPMDARLISQVLVNLLDNAAKNSEEREKIEVKVLENSEENQVEFIVSDHGTGVPPEKLTEIFQMFYTTHGQSTGIKRGVGLGLSICQTIVEAHGGRISADNRKDGNGAVFMFSLPLGGKTE